MSRAVIGFVFASGLVVAACSSSSTGTGTTSNKGGLGGLFGGNSSSGGGATTTGGNNVLPDSCTPSPTEDTCTTCFKQSCCSATLGCRNNAECNTLVNCIVACNGDETCGTSCANAHPNGKADAQTFVDCGDQSCEAQCDSGSTSTSSSSGGSNTQGCLEDPPDATLCSSVTGKTHAHDCPDGAPSTQCVAQPEGLSGIWCCPI